MLTFCVLVTSYGSTSAQAMVCCLTAPSYYVNQCWLLSKVQWHSSEGEASAIKHYNWLDNHFSKISFKSPRGQCLNKANIFYVYGIYSRYCTCRDTFPGSALDCGWCVFCPGTIPDLVQWLLGWEQTHDQRATRKRRGITCVSPGISIYIIDIPDNI